MKTVAVIAEFNPYHKGHGILLGEIKKRYPGSTVIAVMSGNTVQRGDFSVFDKYARAKTAVTGGFDAVFELPFPHSWSAAEQVARAGTYIAASLGAEVLAFGSECGSIEKLTEIARNRLSKEYEQMIPGYRAEQRGESVLRIKEKAYADLYGETAVRRSNDILACEYIKSILTSGYEITPVAVHRVENFSAKDSRKAIYGCDEDEIRRLLPDSTVNFQLSLGMKGAENLILGLLRLDYGSDSGNGIINAMKKRAEKCAGLEELMSMLPTKKYTLARLRREILAWLFSVSEDDKNSIPGYTVLLAANKKGLACISGNGKFPAIPVLTRQSDVNKLSKNAQIRFKTAQKPELIYALTFKDRRNPDLTMTPVIIDV